MKIDKTYGKTGFWIAGMFYPLRKGIKPKEQIKIWKLTISRLSTSIVNIKNNIEKLKVNGYAYGDLNTKIEKLEQLITHHYKEIDKHKLLIDNFNNEIPLQDHAREMIKKGISEDDYNG
jgi:aspartate 1-decarboxylase